ncbi:MAG: UDP-N-acetylglucosamine 1-carboxyvinyltransferase [Clostridia bacterium]|nr:UDP-N-acetylglucosamine 1-carboxyvinyltransferase [Clostridia bacterium]
MGKFLVRGGTALFGPVTVGGSKNAALPVLFATLLTEGTSEIINLPDIGDVRQALNILRSLGAEISASGRRVLINTERLRLSDVPEEYTSSIRASTYLIGSMLGRFGSCRLSAFGGCSFSKRPIDLHLRAAESFGAQLVGHTLTRVSPRTAVHEIGKRSVGATVNSLLLAASTEGQSRLLGYAEEPHIFTLIDFLRSAGAEITVSDGAITVSGGRLHGGRVTIPGDMIEAGTYLAASLVTGGRVRVFGVRDSELSALISPLSSFGARFSYEAGGVCAVAPPSEPVEITTAPYPGFPTDLAPIIAPLLATARGGRITEGVWCERFGYLTALAELGVRSRTVLPSSDIFPSELRPGTVLAPDLRGGAACLIAALGADGESVIDNAEIILRGYEKPIERLGALGAEIEYIK